MPAAPTESAQAPDAVIAPSAVEFEERRLELVVTKDATHFRIPFGARIPRGWGPTVLPGQAAVDGSEGIAAFSAPSDTGAGPDIAFSASICAKCTAEEAHARQEDLAARTGSKVLKTERIEPGRTLLIEEHKGERTAIASRTLTGGSLAVFQCIVAGPPSAIWDELLETCQTLSLGELRPLLDGELLAAEEAKVAGCPAKTSVTYSGNTRATAFDEVKKAGAVLIGPGRVSVRLANSEAAVLEGDEVMEGTLRLDLDLGAPRGKEVTSGTYPGQTEAPPLVEATMMGAPAPVGAPTAPKDCAGGECTPSAGWSGPNQKVEIIARTRTRVCGRFHFEDAGHRVAGEFDVPIALKGARSGE